MRDSNSYRKTALALGLMLCGLFWTLPGSAQSASRLDQVLDAIVENERNLAANLEQYQPLVETYLQTVKPDATLGSVPVKDSYFFGRLELSDAAMAETVSESKTKKSKKKTLNLFDDFYSQSIKPESFARMLLLDRGAFDRNHYDFEFLRTEFLGEIRTLVFDVMPKSGKPLSKMRTARFTGRIWVEDQGFHIVRYNGIYASSMVFSFHFDSWRLNMAPDVWLPAYVYTEEPDRSSRQLRHTHKGQTRIWGYELKSLNVDDEFTKVLIDSSQTEDRSDRPGQVSPVESARAWESEAEDNVLRRLERAGLLAPSGEVDQVLSTVVQNLEITNNLTIEPPIRCRVLLTTPLESFTVGHTIVLSRGLIDVLPDEASLAMVLAHELGHVLSGHELDTVFAFADKVLVGDKQAMNDFMFGHDPNEELEADARALAILQNSPYKDDLAGAGLFLKALALRAPQLPALIRPHFGSKMAQRDQLYRMQELVESAPALNPASIEQTAALPLGGRVKLDPWNAEIELMKNNRVALLSAREKMEFMVTPLMPYLVRFGAEGRPVADDAAQPDPEADDAAREPGNGSNRGSD